MSEADPVVKSAGTLLVVGGRPDTVRKAAAQGIDVILIQHKEHFAPETVSLAKAVIIADYTDWPTVEPLVRAAHEVYGFTACISLTEPGLVPACRINDMFGLNGNSLQVAELSKNKLEMRRHLTTLGGPAAEISVNAAEADSEETLHAFGREHGYPFVVKPADMTASVGVHKVERPEQIPDVWREVEALRARTDLLWGSFFTVGPHLAEEYLEGPEYSVEAFSFDGRHVVVAVTEKLLSRDGFLELGHAQPARIDADTEAALLACTRTFLDAIGQRQGASHTEIKLTPNGPKVVEGHNRIGGDRIVDLLELAYGIDFEMLMITWPLGLAEPLPDHPKPLQAAATRFLTAPGGRVTAVEGAEKVRGYPDVFVLDLTVSPGSMVRPGSNWDRCGQVVVTGPDTDAVVARCEELVAEVEISVELTDQGGSS